MHTFAITTVVPPRTAITIVGDLWLAFDTHTLVACLNSIGKTVMLCTHVWNDKELFTSQCVFKKAVEEKGVPHML